MRVRILILVVAVLLLSGLILVPQIIEAKRANSLAAANEPANSVVITPIQGKKQQMTVGESIRNDTSRPGTGNEAAAGVQSRRKRQTRTRRFNTLTKILPIAWSNRQSRPSSCRPTCPPRTRTSTACSFRESPATVRHLTRTAKSARRSMCRWSTKAFRYLTRPPALPC